MRTLLLLFLALPLGASAVSAQGKASDQNVIDSLMAQGQQWLETFRISAHPADARRARDAFREVLQRTRDHAPAHLGLGLVHTTLEGMALPEAMGDVRGLSNHSLAMRHLQSALQNGSRDAAIYEALRTILLREYNRDRLAETIKEIEQHPPVDDAGKSAVAELYFRAYRAADAARTLDGLQSSSARRLRAIALLMDPATQQQGGAAYLETLSMADSATVAEFILDARWLADPEEARTWSAMSWSEQRARLQQFWQRRALTSAVSIDQRLATHFARVQHALDEFNFYRQRIARFAPDELTINTEPVIGTLRSISPGIHGRLYHVDDRAFIYVRYGEPDERIRTRGENLWNESWVYRHLSDKPVSFDFFLPINASAGMKLDARGWTLVYDVMHCGRTSTLPYLERFVRDRQAIDPRYTMILNQCSSRSRSVEDTDALAASFVKEREQFQKQAMVRDNALPESAEPVPVMADIVQFKGDAKTTDVTAVIAWPLASFKPDAGQIYRARVTFFIADTLAGHVTRRDSTIAVRAPAAGQAPAVRLHFTLPAAPSRQSFYRVLISDLNRTDLNTVIGDSIDVRSFTTGPLSLSDIAVAAPTDGGTWQRLGHRLSLLPRGAAVRNFRLYYEIYGVEPGRDYSTELTFIPEGDVLVKLLERLKGSQTVTIKFQGRNEGNTNVVAEMRALGTELPGGNYTFRVTVTSDGQTATRERLLRIP